LKSFSFCLPTRIVFGNGVAGQVARWARHLGADRVLVVTDHGVRAAGLVDPLLDRLAAEGIEAAVFQDVAPNPRENSVAEGAAVAAAKDCQVLVAVGGGSPMDTAKGIALVLAQGGGILDYAGSDRVQQPIKPLIAIPTTAGSGSEVTFVADITDASRGRKVAVGGPCLAARVALVDPEMTYGLPRALTASTGLDALTHAVEAYTSRRSGPVSDSLALSAVSLLSQSLTTAYADGSDPMARYDVMLGSLMAGMAAANTGSAAVHALAEAVAGHYDVYHGIANAIYLGEVMQHNLLAQLEKFAALAGALGQPVAGMSTREAAQAAVSAVRRLALDLRVPRAEDVGVRTQDFALLAEAALADPGLENNPRPLTEDEILELYQRAQ
jgi:alcohol dehydrogenase class IV